MLHMPRFWRANTPRTTLLILVADFSCPCRVSGHTMIQILKMVHAIIANKVENSGDNCRKLGRDPVRKTTEKATQCTPRPRIAQHKLSNKPVFCLTVGLTRP
ncbi:hypothetical protein QBC33DRAFT_131180 [Phialemonium atrogriseum]|uniref:Secreted protein n=1 Tax=Phialemonium atrogriseum TaxID=1093897 RepID=A0AAJ0BZ20_9PEZI|nr:uncharacterized protein QBC33DRAFT_131180 [Phialemonium atrogriseum]KAK1765682.1 hypothetical protein QBC33DRAFT_131180 [Phialemonium atrogriseum]